MLNIRRKTNDFPSSSSWKSIYQNKNLELAFSVFSRFKQIFYSIYINWKKLGKKKAHLIQILEFLTAFLFLAFNNFCLNPYYQNFNFTQILLPTMKSIFDQETWTNSDPTLPHTPTDNFPIKLLPPSGREYWPPLPLIIQTKLEFNSLSN